MPIDQVTARQLADIIAIRDLVWRFADAVNRNSQDDFVALWHPEGHWLSDPPANLDARGHIALSILFATLMGLWRSFHHIPTAGPVTITANRAMSSSYVQEVGIAKDGSKMRNFGRYDDEFIRTEDGWRFLTRNYKNCGGS